MKIVYMIVISFSILGILYELLGYQLRSMEQKEKDRVFFHLEQAGRNKTLALYEFLSHFLLTRYWILRVKKRMDGYTPGDERRAVVLTMKLISLIALTTGIDLTIIVLTRPSWIMTVILLSAVYFVNSGMSQYFAECEETRLLTHLVRFVSDMRHNYHANGLVEDCIEQSIQEETPEDIRLHGVYLLDVVSSEDAEDKIKDYLDHVPNVYLKELLTLCVTVSVFGDYTLEGQSLFLTSLRNLKQSVNTELLRRKRQKHMFGGYAFIIAAPIFTISFISSWAINTMPSLKIYYEGSYGILYSVFAFLSTILIYQINLKLQQFHYQRLEQKTLLFYVSRHKTIDQLVKRILSRNQGKRMRKEELIRESGLFLRVEELILRQMVYAGVSFLGFLAVFASLPGGFQKEYLLICLVLAVVFYWIPIILLKYQCICAKQMMLDEVMQFQAIIYMLTPIPQMSPELLLSWLEHFAVVFQKTIASCMDFMAANEEEAIEQLLETEQYEPFLRLIGNLKVSDRIGLNAAFDELGTERIYFQEERKQKGDMNLENRGAVGAFLAMIPTFVIVVGYLFLPFIIESISMFSNQLTQIQF